MALLKSMGRVLVPYDNETKSFIDVLNADTNGIVLTSNQRYALHSLVHSLKRLKDVGKTTSVWDRCIAIYPFLGDSAYKVRFNLKDPRDSVAAFRLTLGSSISVSTLGVQAISNTAPTTKEVIFTGIVPDVHLISNNKHLAIYTPTTDTVLPTAYPADIGVNYPNTNEAYSIASKWSNTLQCAYRFSESGQVLAANLNGTPARGLTVGSSIPGSNFLSKNDQIMASNTITPTTTKPISQLTICGLNRIEGSGPFGLSDRLYNFASIGEGLTQTEAIILFKIVLNYQSLLSRDHLRF